MISSSSCTKESKDTPAKIQKPQLAFKDTIIYDSKISLDEGLQGIQLPKVVRDNLSIVNVNYLGFDNKTHQGQLIVHKKLSKEVQEIFTEIYAAHFQIESIKPISFYGWSDEKSMLSNNTSSFNYRTIAGTNIISLHSYGAAIDINPVQNPYIYGSTIQPLNARYIPKARGTITTNSVVVREFKKHGWEWAGEWIPYQDYQHFQKVVR